MNFFFFYYYAKEIAMSPAPVCNEEVVTLQQQHQKDNLIVIMKSVTERDVTAEVKPLQNNNIVINDPAAVEVKILL